MEARLESTVPATQAPNAKATEEDVTEGRTPTPTPGTTPGTKAAPEEEVNETTTSGSTSDKDVQSTAASSRKKRSFSSTEGGSKSNPLLTAATLSAALSTAHDSGMLCSHSLLLNTGMVPTPAQILQVWESGGSNNQGFVHWNVRDSAPQLKIVNNGPNHTVKGSCGYRTARASHGVSSGTYYYEVWVLPDISIRNVGELLPPNARLAPKIKAQLQQAVRDEQEAIANNSVGKGADAGVSTEEPKRKKAKTSSSASTTSQTIGHCRLGWSMRTGELQAPVGYDKWSFAIRDISGSRVHNSRREDSWGGESFGPGDVVGLCISIPADNEKKGEIRFFKNGNPMGQLIVTRGVRSGGAAFVDIPEGTYYPAVSCYMGATVKANFGPHFLFPPRQLPTGLKVKPVSDLCPNVSASIAVPSAGTTGVDGASVKRLQEALNYEASLRRRAYQDHYEQHVEDVRQARQERGLSTSDLPSPPTPDTEMKEAAEQ